MDPDSPSSPPSPNPRRGRTAVDRAIVAVVWDLDGALVSAEALHRSIERDVLAARGVALPEDRAWAGAGSRAVIDALLTDAGREDEVEAAVIEARALARARVVSRAVPLRGAEDVLRDIPMRTHRFALVSVSSREVALGLLERLGWSWRFEVVVAAEEAGPSESAPNPYRSACDELGVPPRRVLVVAHAPRVVRAGKAAGCRVAAIPNAFTAAELGEADFVVSNLGAVVGLLGVLG